MLREVLLDGTQLKCFLHFEKSYVHIRALLILHRNASGAYLRDTRWRKYVGQSPIPQSHESLLHRPAPWHIMQDAFFVVD
jgi:hypothetical protein